MFARIKFLLAAFDRQEFCEVGLALRLREYESRSDRAIRPARKVTVAGLPVAWGEP